MNHKFRSALKYATLDAVRSFGLDGPSVVRWHRDECVSPVISTLLHHGIVTYDELRTVVDERIRQIGLESYNYCLRTERCPDHCESPEALAYAIKHGALTDTEAARLRYDEDEDSLSFVETFYRSDMCSYVLQVVCGVQ